MSDSQIMKLYFVKKHNSKAAIFREKGRVIHLSLNRGLKGLTVKLTFSTQ